MAVMKRCPNCGHDNPPSNRFCEDCGCNMDKVPGSSSAVNTPKISLRCPNGHATSDTSLGFCDVCGEKLIPSMIPDFKSPDSSPIINPGADTVSPDPSVNESHGKKCPSPTCGAINPEGNRYCEECGALLDVEPDPDPDPEPIPEPIPRPLRTELPAIPDIMHVLTNEDMKLAKKK